MTTNWEFKYLSSLNEFYFAYLKMYNFIENVQSELQFTNFMNSSLITYPFFKIRMYDIDMMGTEEFWWFEQEGTGVNYRQRGLPQIENNESFVGNGLITKNHYVTGYIQLFDNLGDITYTEDLNNGQINISRRFDDSCLKIEIIECSEQNINPYKEIGVVWSGNITFNNTTHPMAIRKEYGESENNEFSTTISRFREFDLNRRFG